MLNEVKSRNTGRKIISFMHISLDGFVAGPNGEMNWIKVDEEIFDHAGKRISKATLHYMEGYRASEKVITFAKQHVVRKLEK